MGYIAGETGKVLRMRTNFDLSGNSGLRLFIRAPSNIFTETIIPPVLGTVTVGTGKTAAIANKYSDYTTEATDFPVCGRYLLRLEVDYPGGKQLKTKEVIFNVDE